MVKAADYINVRLLKRDFRNQWETVRNPFKWNSTMNRDLNVNPTFRDQHQNKSEAVIYKSVTNSINKWLAQLKIKQ